MLSQRSVLRDKILGEVHDLTFVFMALFLVTELANLYVYLAC